jgi:hypothetical protein
VDRIASEPFCQSHVPDDRAVIHGAHVKNRQVRELAAMACAATAVLMPSASCAQSQAPHAAAVAPPAKSDTATLARAQFEKFLSLAIATRQPHVGMIDSVYTCGDEESRDDMRWIAAFRILSVSVAGDSGRAAAALTVVAIQKDGLSGWTARFGIREDTAHWELKRSAETGGRWMICGDTYEHFGVFHLGRDVKWLRGSTSEAIAAVDSIRRARGLPIIR